MISVVLIEPRKSGNLGAICRVMKNFGFNELVVVNPRCKVDSLEARKRSKHANDVLKKIKVVNSKYLDKFDYLISTTARLGTDYNISRSPISPEQLSGKLKEIDVKKLKIGLVFGRENNGLTNEEIERCDFTITVPTKKEYPVMNLSHAVGIVLYEISKNEENISSHVRPALKVEKRIALKMVDQLLKKVKFSTPDKIVTQRKLWKKLIGKSFLGRREAFALLGFFRKLNEKFK
jgi:tRNA/rRNA methyltransferase